MANDTVATFVRLFLAASRKLELLLTRLHPLLTADQSYVLAEIRTAAASGEAITAQVISSRLRIEKSTLSRLLSRLSDAHMISFLPNPEDRRERLLRLSAVGEKFLVRDAAAREQQLAEFSKRLLPAEIIQLAGFLARMADALDEPRGPKIEGEHILRPGIRRLTHALGFLGGEIFGSPVSLEEAQMLALLTDHREGLPRVVITEKLPYDQTRISRMLTKFEEEGLLMRQIHPQDRRQFIIRLGAKGEERFEMVLRAAEPVFEKGLAGFSMAEQRAFVSLLERACAQEETQSEAGFSSMDGIVLIRSERERKEARGFLIRFLARENRAQEAGEVLISHRSHTYVLIEGGEPKVLMEAVPAGQGWCIEHFAEDADSAPVFDVFAALCRDLFARLGADKIEIAAPALRRKFGLETGTLFVTGQTWEEVGMRLSSKRLDA